MSANSITRLNIAATAVSYFEMTDRPLSADIIIYGLCMKNFKVHMDAIKDMKKDDARKTPNLYKTLAIQEYLESLDVYCASKIGAMMWPLAWVIRENATVPANAPVMEQNQPYSTVHGLVMEEMVQCYSHGHTLFATDSSAIYDLLDAATRVTKYHATIAPYMRGARKDGRVAYIAMNAQFCGTEF